jgi:hypothetical protein
MTLRPDTPNDGSTGAGASDQVGDDFVAGEARWPGALRVFAPSETRAARAQLGSRRMKTDDRDCVALTGPRIRPPVWGRIRPS